MLDDKYDYRQTIALAGSLFVIKDLLVRLVNCVEDEFDDGKMISYLKVTSY